MKLICLTESYGGRAMIRPAYWGDGLFFADEAPPVPVFVTLDLPGLKEITAAAIITWLSEAAGRGNLFQKLAEAFKPPPRREINELPSSVWRRTVLEDFLVADNYQQAMWRLPEQFSLAEISDFCDRHLPEARRRMRAALAIKAPADRSQALVQLEPFLSRVMGVAGQAAGRTLRERIALIKEIESGQIAALQAGDFEPGKWVELAARLQTTELITNLLIDAFTRLVRQQAGQPELHNLLQKIAASDYLKRMTTYNPQFWIALQPHLRLESTLVDQTIDISQAQEQTAQLNWQLVEANRVGRIIPDRTALVAYRDGRYLYIAGERKLKFQIARARGKLKRFDNVLTMPVDQTSLQAALLEVEMLDLLANVDPAQALGRVEHLALPTDHPAFQAAEAAQTDPRQARILADLLIELAVGIDADIARRLIRSQQRRNRR